jgi:hypothetical protein
MSLTRAECLAFQQNNRGFIDNLGQGVGTTGNFVVSDVHVPSGCQWLADPLLPSYNRFFFNEANTSLNNEHNVVNSACTSSSSWCFGAYSYRVCPGLICLRGQFGAMHSCGSSSVPRCNMVSMLSGIDECGNALLRVVNVTLGLLLCVVGMIHMVCAWWVLRTWFTERGALRPSRWTAQQLLLNSRPQKRSWLPFLRRRKVAGADDDGVPQLEMRSPPECAVGSNVYL